MVLEVDVPLIIINCQGPLVIEVAHESKQWKEGLCTTTFQKNCRRNWLRPFHEFNCSVQVLQGIPRQGAAAQTINSIPITSLSVFFHFT